MIYLVNAFAALAAAFLLSFAIAADWRNMRPAWRPVLIAGTIEQGVLAYGCIEARNSNVEVELRVVLFTLSIVGLVLALLISLVLTRSHFGRQVWNLPADRS